MPSAAKKDKQQMKQQKKSKGSKSHASKMAVKEARRQILRRGRKKIT